ncbi:MAG: ornithine cyclodeaminase family protein [Anaerolineales bacterium]|nr:ornithine cyclodeaminase family protein [Anaerolineales bacterium]
MTLYLTESDVEKILTMPDALRVIEDVFYELGRHAAINRPRQRVRVPSSILHVMAGGLPTRGYLGLKYYISSRLQTRFWFHLLDAKTGDWVAVMQADRLGQIRTGAASGIATKYLARADASIVGILGTGWQAESQLQAICRVRPIRIIKCYSRAATRRDAFAQKMRAQLKIETRAVAQAEDAVRESDIVVTATSARDPVLLGEWLAPGTHVNAVGSNRAEAREVDDVVLARSAFVCVDSLEQARFEAGDLIAPIERGIASWARVRELGEVVVGKTGGRVERDDITFFKSVGLAVEDIAVGAWVYERARERKIGKEIAL